MELTERRGLLREDRHRRWWAFTMVLLTLLWVGGFLLETLLSQSGSYPKWGPPVVLISLVLGVLIDQVFPPAESDQEQE